MNSNFEKKINVSSIKYFVMVVYYLCTLCNFKRYTVIILLILVMLGSMFQRYNIKAHTL